MSQLNTGPTVARNRVSVIILFGAFFLALALLLALQGEDRSTSASPSKPGNPVSPNDMCWQVVPSPNQGTYDNVLHGVAAVSATDVWAVGGGSSDTLVEHWNGSAWTIVSSPNPPYGSNDLYAVAAVSANDVWVVGHHFNNNGTTQTLVEHWNGSAWTIVSSPSPGTELNWLTSVAAISANDVWAVGSYSNVNATSQTLVEHWNGSAWSIVASPNQGTSSNVLYGVAAVAANDVWAVGSYYNDNSGTSQTLVEHWNGSAWTIVSSPNQGTATNVLRGVAVVSANDVWAVGHYNMTGTSQTLVEHWNGSAWSIIASPNQGTSSNVLYGVAAVAANDVWAVGYSGDGTLVEHWDGTAWTLFPAIEAAELMGVVAVSANDVWAVGVDYSLMYSQTLVQRYSSCGNITPTPTPEPPTATPTLGPTTATPTPCTAGQFSDVLPGSTFYPYVTCLVNRAIISGYSDCTFRPGNNITRGQLAKIVSNAAGFSDPAGTQMFEDVLPGSTFYDFVQRLASRGYIGGYPCGGPGEPCGPQNLPYFRPGSNATRGQISKIVSNAAGFTDPAGTQMFEDVVPGSTFYDFVQRLASRSIINGYPCGGVGEPCGVGNLPYFRTNNNASRGQTSKIVANTFFPNCQTP